MSDDSDSNDFNDNHYMQQMPKWSREDDDKLITLFKRIGHNWEEIGKRLGKSSRQCQDRYNKISGKFMKDYDHRIEKKKLNAYWTVGDDVLLLQLIERFGTDNWKQISDKIKTKDLEECVKRYQFIRESEEFEEEEEEIDLTWTLKEDSLLIFSYRKYGGDWRKVLKRFKHRDIPSLQQRWSQISQMQQISPQLFWDIDRDTKIVKSFLNNRTFITPSQELCLSEELCENRFNYIIARLGGYLEKRGVKIELPRKVQDAINLKDIVAPQTNQTTSNNQKYDPLTEILQGKSETIPKFEIPQIQQPQALQVKQDNDQQNNQNNYPNEVPIPTQVPETENQTIVAGQPSLISNTIQLIEKSLEVDQKHLDSLHDIKDLLLQNIIQ